MGKKYNWGIIGPGKIAHKFAESLKLLTNANMYAVASRSKIKAEEFAKKYSFEKYYDSYEELLKDEDVDVVYIATTNNLHYEHTMMALSYNKAVLCEKPSTLSSQQLKDIITFSKANNVFYMEALWTRFLPSIDKINSLISSKKIGELRHIIADFGFFAEYDTSGRLFAKELGGGSIWDIGIYPIFLALYLLGKPDDILATQNLSETGVDISTSCIFSYKDGKTAMLFSCFDAITLTEAKIIGSKATIKMHQNFHTPIQLSIHDNDINENIPISYESNGYSYQAREVMNSLDNNQYENKLMSHAFSLLIVETIEKIIILSKKQH